MESKGNSIELSTFLKYVLTEVKKCSIIDDWLGSKNASVNITIQGFYLKKNKILRNPYPEGLQLY